LPTAEEYRRSAQECRRLAQESHDAIERETLLRMAAQWDHLAAYKGKLENEQR
jgi:hypothetical protein